MKKYLQLLCIACLCYQANGQAVINVGKTNQVIDGFGGSSAWSGQLSTAVLDALYKNGNNQLGLSIIRLRIDPNKAWTDEKANAKNAKARGATVFATPWSPPKSMKTNNDLNNGGEIKSTEWGNYALYLNEFIDYVGSDLDIISLQNEPDWQPNYESCKWSATQFHDFCKNYAGTLKRPVMFPESLGYNWALSDPTLDDAAAAKNVSYIGGHLYGAQPKSYTKALNLGKHVWMTEWYNNDLTANGLMIYSKLILDCMYQNFSAYVYWWMTQSDGIISPTGTLKKNGYILGQFAKYIRPGYYRVDATYNPQSGVYVVAFKGANKFVTVVVNNSTSAKTQQFTVQNGSVTTLSKTTTSLSKDLANDGTVTVTNGTFSSTLDAQSITTFVGDMGNVPQVVFTSPTKTGTYTVGTPISLDANATISVGTISNVKFYDGATLLNTDNSSPYSFSWTNATSGKHLLKAVATDNAGNTAFDTLTIKVNVPQGPYNGIVHPIPGIIQAEEYDLGGNGIAYSDDSPGNTGGATFRTDEEVDLETCTDVGGGYNLGYATAGEWLEYTVNVAATGNYKLDLRVACNGDGRTLSLTMDGTSIANNIAIPNTTGWQTWTTTTVNNVPLTVGQHILRMTVGTTSYLNLNYMTFSSVITGTEDATIQNSFTVFPNPFGSEGLHVNKAGEFRYKINGMNGVLLEEGKGAGSKQMGQNLAPGIYFLTLEDEKGVNVQKIVRQ
jgi:O-glycosyl hydrolase